MHNIDHFMIAGGDLDRLSARFTSMTGIPATVGGSHPDLGTRNKLVATTSDVYLELIAPDPDLSVTSGLREVIAQMEEPVLHRVIVLGKLDDFPAIVHAYERAGVMAEIKPLTRVTASGDVLNWHLLMPAAQNELGIFAPLIIDWGRAAHPSRSLPPAPCTLVKCKAVHPDPERVRALWQGLGFELPITQAAAPRMSILLDTPKGRVEFCSSHP